ncbi:hypothetical protein [Ruegeria atlantica]|uniref:hypothetical protein n=1 Tax=Ruegeria atlantica TaxID=81569 RepID=UPI0024953CD7|nr:hypothetical protein [Ruegeria atlantica]
MKKVVIAPVVSLVIAALSGVTFADTFDVSPATSQTQLQSTMSSSGGYGKSPVVCKECREAGSHGTELIGGVTFYFLELPEVDIDARKRKNVFDIDAGTVIKRMRC